MKTLVCKSSPLCSHNTNGRDLDKPCSIEFKKTPLPENAVVEKDKCFCVQVSGDNPNCRIHTKKKRECSAEDMHPYECDGIGRCIHCDKGKNDKHDPETCALCDSSYDDGTDEEP